MKKILVVSPAWIGDAVMAQPLYRRLHVRHPDLELHVLAPEWTRPLLSRMPEVAFTHQNPFAHGQLRLWARFKLGRRLAHERFDQCIVLPNSLKSALVPFFAGIPCRTGFTGEMRYGLLNDIRLLNEAALPSMVARFNALAEVAGDVNEHPAPYPRLVVNPAAQQDSLKALGLQLDTPVAICCPGAEYGPAKRWPTQHFAELSQRLVRQGYQVWLLGSEQDRERGADIVTLSGSKAINLCGRTSLDQAIDLLALARIAVCNDSGLMHIAAALNIPLVGIYGSSSPDFTPPLSKHAAIATLNLNCSPCFERNCPLQHMNCLNQLNATIVESAIDQALHMAQT